MWRLFFSSEQLIIDFKRLKGKWKGFSRIKYQKYRILLTLEKKEKIIKIHAVGYRKDIYK